MTPKMLILLILISNTAFAHGMNELGPHNGYIKMPGAFHTELVDAKSQINVYLLDMAFKNPTTNNSSVKIKYIGKSTVKYSCSKNVDHFICKQPAKLLTNYKKIILKTIRNNQKATEAVYDLPLKLD